MGAFFVFFIVAVLIWAVVSLSLLFVWQKKDDQPQAERKGTTGDGRKGSQEKKRDASEFRETKEPYSVSWPKGSDNDWKQQLSHIPGVLGWLLIDTYGAVLQASDLVIQDAAVSDPTIRKIVTLISQLNPEVGDNSLRLMEWEGPQGQVLVAFPEEVHTPERLVLFLDTEAFKHQMRDLLAQLKWESRAEKVAAGS